MLRYTRPLVSTLGLGLFAACSGFSSCGGCSNLSPIPGGFPADRTIDRAVEVKLTTSGLDFIGREFSNLVLAYARSSCGQPGDVPCPTSFVVGGNVEPSVCGPGGFCQGSTSAMPEPVIGFEVETATQSGAVVCRDDPASPSRRRCYAWLRLEALTAQPAPPNQLSLRVSAQVYTTPIPLRYAPLGMDCVVTLDSNARSRAFQDFDLTVGLGSYAGGSVQPNGQLDVQVSNVTATIPDTSISIMADPVHGSGGDVLLCGLANLGRIKTALVGRLIGTLGGIINDQLDATLGTPCVGPRAVACPSGSTCNADGLCQEDGGPRVVPNRFAFEGRAAFDQLLAGLPLQAGQVDLSALVGGSVPRVDAQGATLPVRVGLESAPSGSSCVPPGLSPRARPGYQPPSPLQLGDQVDLDFDGTPEKPFMLGAGLTRAIVDQVLWSAYQSGLFCASISSADTAVLNTGSLAVLMPSLQALTHQDRYVWSVAPARVRVRPLGVPSVSFGPGRTVGTSPNITLADPLVSIKLPDLELRFSALIEERWVQLMTVTADVELPLGLFADPNGALLPLIGDVSRLVTRVRVTEADLLREPASDLEQAVPTLLSLVLPQLTSQLLQSITLPGGRDLGGFTPTFVGARGVQDALGRYEHAGLFFDLMFDRTLARPNFRFVDTRARVARWSVPASAAMAVGAGRAPQIPELTIIFDSEDASARPLEHQVRVDGGLWSAFVRGGEVVLARPELLAQSRHRVEVRARAIGDQRSLDPSPVTLEVVTDSEPPRLQVERVAGEAALRIGAGDVVDGTDVELELRVDGASRALQATAEPSVVAVPELSALDHDIVVRARDRSGLVAEVVVQRALSAAPQPAADASVGGCSAVAPRDLSGLLLALGLVGLRRRARRPSPASS